MFEMLGSESEQDRDARSALEYLQQWGEGFWVETEYRVREITSKMEKKLESEIGFAIPTGGLDIGASLSGHVNMSEEQKMAVIQRSQRIVSQAQVKDLSKVRNILERFLSDRQKSYYIIIDRLDENWVEEKLRYRLIMALLDSVKEVSRVSNIKILIAIRHDLLERVFRLVREAGFQEEKYHSLCVSLSWSRNKLMEILNKRIGKLVSRPYEKSKKVTYADLLPKKIDGKPIVEFIYERAKRPRDIIDFFNNCINMAEGKSRLVADTVKRAEGVYSSHRLRALRDEWYADYPSLLDFVDILKKRPHSFSLNQVEDDQLAELCLNSLINYSNEDEYGILRQQARNVVDMLVPVKHFKQSLFMIFYKIGLVGLKIQSFQTASWIDESTEIVSPSELDENTSVVVHPTYRRVLGILTR